MVIDIGLDRKITVQSVAIGRELKPPNVRINLKIILGSPVNQILVVKKKKTMSIDTLKFN
jgi:hypothetical protein